MKPWKMIAWSTVGVRLRTIAGASKSQARWSDISREHHACRRLGMVRSKDDVESAAPGKIRGRYAGIAFPLHDGV